MSSENLGESQVQRDAFLQRLADIFNQILMPNLKEPVDPREIYLLAAIASLPYDELVGLEERALLIKIFGYVQPTPNQIKNLVSQLRQELRRERRRVILEDGE